MKETDKQARMKEIINKYKHYVDTYDFLHVDDVTFIKDMIYGIGIVINPEEYSWADGFQRWNKVVKLLLQEKKNDSTSSNKVQ